MSDLANQNVDRQGVALVQYLVHSAQWIFREHKEVDHGIDAHIETTVGDKVTGRMIAIQIKTGSSYFEEATDEGFVFRGNQRHLEYWLEHSLPVLLLLVDLEASRTYWVQVTESNVISTGKGWKIIVPRHNTLNAAALGELSKIAVNLRILRPYSVLELKDVSHAAAKRYSAEILLNSDYPKHFVRSLASEITKQISLETWMRSQQLEQRFAGRPADVVWLFMCRTVDDAKQANWLCRSQWISPNLDERFRPIPISPDIPLGGIGIVWSDMRSTMEQFALERELSKGEAATAITQTIQQLVEHIETQRPHFESFIEAPSPAHPSITLLRAEAARARDLYFKAGEIGIPPLELSDLMMALDSVLASYDNAFMLFGEELLEDADSKRAAILVAGYLSTFDSDLSHFRDEAKRRNIKA